MIHGDTPFLFPHCICCFCSCSAEPPRCRTICSLRTRAAARGRARYLHECTAHRTWLEKRRSSALSERCGGNGTANLYRPRTYCLRNMPRPPYAPPAPLQQHHPSLPSRQTCTLPPRGPTRHPRHSRRQQKRLPQVQRRNLHQRWLMPAQAHVLWVRFSISRRSSMLSQPRRLSPALRSMQMCLNGFLSSRVSLDVIRY